MHSSSETFVTWYLWIAYGIFEIYESVLSLQPSQMLSKLEIQA